MRKNFHYCQTSVEQLICKPIHVPIKHSISMENYRQQKYKDSLLRNSPIICCPSTNLNIFNIKGTSSHASGEKKNAICSETVHQSLKNKRFSPLMDSVGVYFQCWVGRIIMHILASSLRKHILLEPRKTEAESVI